MNGTSREIRAFVDAHPDGWTHDEWLGLLHHLTERGLDVSDPDGIGLALEQEHLRATLGRSGVKGLGPKRIEAIATGYGTLHDLRGAEGADLAAKVGIPRKLAEEVSHFLR